MPGIKPLWQCLNSVRKHFRCHTARLTSCAKLLSSKAFLPPHLQTWQGGANRVMGHTSGCLPPRTKGLAEIPRQPGPCHHFLRQFSRAGVAPASAEQNQICWADKPPCSWRQSPVSTSSWQIASPLASEANAPWALNANKRQTLATRYCLFPLSSPACDQLPGASEGRPWANQNTKPLERTAWFGNRFPGG